MIEAKCDNCGKTAPTMGVYNTPPDTWIIVRRGSGNDAHTCSPACAHAAVTKLERDDDVKAAQS